MGTREQRRGERHAIRRWSGRYRLESAVGWRDCRLVDISESGAGFEAFMLATDVAAPGGAELELVDQLGDGDGPIRLQGQIRHLTRSPEGHVRVGIEFVGLTELERRLLGLLFAQRDAGRSRRAAAVRE